MADMPIINVPIALSVRRSATLTLPWFAQRTEFGVREATFTPLINGEAAFGAIYDAMARARHTIDIICWGFQPSMYFKRGANGQGTLPIGQLLENKGTAGVQIRLLSWFDPLHLTDLFSENMQPGNNLRSQFPDVKWLPWLSRDPRNSTQRDFDLHWYQRADLTEATRSLSQMLQAANPVFALRDTLVKDLQGTQPIPNLQFAVRNFDPVKRAEIAWRTWRQHNDGQDSAARTLNSLAFEIEPTHHQKTVLIDYEDPERAVGFVMGHNMLDEYWDTNAHSYYRKHPQMGRSGFHPRHDLSSCITGPILEDLNTNFCVAWDRATGQNLTQARTGMGERLKERRSEGTAVMAKLYRTQSQEGRQDIQAMYLQAAGLVTNFAYIENQYFRWQPLADKIKESAKKQFSAGRDVSEHGPIYLFVVTNDNAEGIGDGTVNTYHMLDALGQADSIPAVAKHVRDTTLAEQRQQLDEQLTWERAGTPPPAGFAVDPASAYAQQVKQQRADHLQKQHALQQQIADVDKQIQANQQEPIASLDIDGLKVIVCSLVPPDTPAGEPWGYTYIHAKLMIVDDVFTTLGSANLNKRSMEVDSEINICHEHGGVTAPLRRALWDMHTDGKGAQDDMAEAFNTWTVMARKNATNRQKRHEPEGALVKFNYAGNKISYKD